MRRIAELDGLRGVCAMLIVAVHLFNDYLPGCWAALDVFFVLSGYLITSIVIQHDLSWQFLKSFYLRRGLRIWPIYYLLILVLTLVGLGNIPALPYYLSYTQRTPAYWGGDMPRWLLLEHTWSLALEEQFYLIWPVVVLLAGKRRMEYLALAIAAIAVEARYAGFHWWLLLARCDGFALGGFLALITAGAEAEQARFRALRWSMVFAFLAVLQAGLLIRTGHLFHGFGPMTMAARATLASLGSFILVALVISHAGHPMLALLRTTPLVYLGTISYGIYLYHYPIFRIIDMLNTSLGVAPVVAVCAADCIVTLGIAMASWHLIELPILRLKDRIPYGRIAGARQRGESTSGVLTATKMIQLVLGRVST
jgi:peptidoglycan/LPS O-acetylase OafA/YrhL